MYRIGAVTVIVLVTLVSVFAQSAEEVRKVNDAMLVAGPASDRAAYSKMVSDDLRWVSADGVVLSKAQRIAQLDGGPAPKFSEVDIKVYGDTAVMLARADFASGRKGRAHRVFVKRGGQWQLVSHSDTPIK